MRVIASSLRKGNVVEKDGQLYIVLSAESFFPGKGTPTTQVDMRRMSDGVKAVSYTHLDVYKRQLHHRAGASACGRRAQGKRGADAQGLGRSRGGLSTKIHAAGDALGNPVRLIASPGQRNDIAFAHDLVDGFDAGATIADKGYDADHLCCLLYTSRCV